MPELQRKGRIVVIEQAYHQGPGMSPTGEESRYTRDLSTDEQAFIRIMKVGGEFIPLDLGWIKECSLLKIRFDKSRRETYPTDEQASLEASQRLIVAVEDDGHVLEFSELPAGESLRLPPFNPQRFVVRSSGGDVRITIEAYPG